MCQMYKREEGVNHEVAGVWLQIRFLLFVFIHWFCFVFIKQKSTQDTQACVSLLPWNVCCHDIITHAHTPANKPKDRQVHKVQVTGSRST